MELKVYLAILRGNLKVVLATTIATVVIVTIATLMVTPIFTATTTLRIATAAGGSITYSDYMYADRLMNTYVKIATSSPVLEELKRRLDVAVALQVRVEALANTELIRISVENADPLLAQSAANNLADILVEQGKELYSGGGKSPQAILGDQLTLAEAELKKARQDYEDLVGQRPDATEEISAASRTVDLKENTYAYLLDQYEQARLRETIRANIISIVEPASLPRFPTRPRTLVNIALGLLVGLCGGVGLAFLFENLSSRLYTSDQIESITGMALLSKIPSVESDLLSPTKSRYFPPNAPFREAFRRLRTNLFTLNLNGSKNSPHSLLVTSAAQGEGKSTIAAHLAMATVQTGQKVVLIDADLRYPSQHKIFELSNDIGLSNILKQTIRLDEAIQTSRFPGLNIITSGTLPPNPSELLGSPKMKDLIDELANRYNVVILDTPAFLPVADTSVLAPMMDGVVLVVRRNFIREEAVLDVCKQLKDIKTRKIGVVVNEAEQNGNYYYYRSKSDSF